MSTVYIIEQRPDSRVSGNVMRCLERGAYITTRLPKTMDSKTVAPWGDLGTRGLYTYQAHGAYGSVSEARAVIEKRWPESRPFDTELPDIVEAFKIG